MPPGSSGINCSSSRRKVIVVTAFTHKAPVRTAESGI